MNKLTTYKPYGSIFDGIDEVFESFFENEKASYTPAVDITSDENNYYLEAELPGLTETDVEIKVEENLLTISSISKEVKEEKQKERWVLRERRSRSFTRSFVLPKDVNKEDIKANFKNGLLNLEIPKAEKEKPRVISINSK